MDLDEEHQRVIAAWGLDPQTTIDVLRSPSLLDIREKLTAGEFGVVHFMGHGCLDPNTGEGLVFLQNGKHSSPVRAKVLAATLKGIETLRLVFLNACLTGVMPSADQQDPYSGVGSALALAGLPAVVAMRRAIPDKAAIVFSGRFYQSLAAGLPVEAATAEGRLAVHLAFPDTDFWATPVVYLNSLSGPIFARTATEAPRVKELCHRRLSLSLLATLTDRQKTQMLRNVDRNLSRNPDSGLQLFQRGLLLLDLRRYEEAATALSRAREPASETWYLGFYLAFARLAERSPGQVGYQDLKQIETVLCSALEKRGDNQETLLLLAFLKARYFLERRITVEPPSIAELGSRLRSCLRTAGELETGPDHRLLGSLRSYRQEILLSPVGG